MKVRNVGSVSTEWVVHVAKGEGSELHMWDYTISTSVVFTAVAGNIYS